jgi:hypothetical protein
MARETAEGVPTLLAGHRASEDVDPVPGHDSDDEVAAMLDPGFAQFLGTSYAAIPSLTRRWPRSFPSIARSNS